MRFISGTNSTTTRGNVRIACLGICVTNIPRRNEESAMPRNGASTIRDVARESGYSASTVSIVLNNAPLSRYIPGETKERIQTAAKRLGYRPNPLARSLRSQRSNIVGVMVFDRRVEGLIVVANWLVTDIKVLADLTEKQVPTVIAGRAFEIENVSTV